MPPADAFLAAVTPLLIAPVVWVAVVQIFTDVAR